MARYTRRCRSCDAILEQGDAPELPVAQDRRVGQCGPCLVAFCRAQLASEPPSPPPVIPAEPSVLWTQLLCRTCGGATAVMMPQRAVLDRWACPACMAELTAAPPDHCVFCRYGPVPCPPRQLALGMTTIARAKRSAHA